MRKLVLRLASVLAIFATTLCNAADKPNIIYMMADDMGYSDIGCYGSEIETPNLDSLATGGLRFTQFYNTARCCPTRACLLTGLYPHQAGVGHMMSDRGYDGYRGDLNRNCVTIAEALKSAGYLSYISGKWHVTKTINPKTETDKHNWPLQRGFDRFYGTIHGAGSFFDPNTLTRGNTYISPYDDAQYQAKDQANGEYYYTDAIADHAVKFVQEHHYQSDDKPFFMYVAFTAAHWPMHALEKDIQKYQGKYDDGYQAIRDARYKKMLDEGVIEKNNTDNWAIPENWQEKDHWDWDKRNMEVYAAMIDSMDQGIGRIIESLKNTGQLENTLICFFQDNGGCAEDYGRGGVGGPRSEKPTMAVLPAKYLQPDMTPKQSRDGFKMRTGKGSMAGPADTAIGYGRGWATVSNTPFREYKHWVHEGGISTPLIVHWPDKIKRRGEIETTPGHLIDLMATAVDVGDASYPDMYHGNQKIKPMEGKSLVPLFTGQKLQREAIYWEHEGNRAIRVGDLKLVAKGGKGAWELYDISKDRSEQKDLAKQMPEKVKELSDQWQAYAERANVLPVNPGQKKKVLSNKKNFVLKQGDNLSAEQAPVVVKKTFHVTADVDITGDGVIVAQGGTAHGWAIYIQEGLLKIAFTSNSDRQVFATADPVRGKHQINARFERKGKIQVKVDGKLALVGNAKQMVVSHPDDGLQVGSDANGNVGIYKAPFPMSGTIKKVAIDIGNTKR